MKGRLLMVGAGLLVTASLAHAQLGTSAGNSTISISVAAEAALVITTGTTNLTSAGSNFSPYTGTTNLTYFVRTTPATGSGTINLKVSTDFLAGACTAASGSPCVAHPPTAGDTLSYTCTASAPATACSGSQTSSTTATTPVASFGADAHSSFAGNSASTTWSLVNDPIYKVGTYTAIVTFTISAA